MCFRRSFTFRPPRYTDTPRYTGIQLHISSGVLVPDEMAMEVALRVTTFYQTI